MENVSNHVVNFSVTAKNARTLRCVLQDWLSYRRPSVNDSDPNGKYFSEIHIEAWVEEFQIYLDQAESFQS